MGAFVRLILVKPVCVYLFPLERPYVALQDIVLLASPQVGEEWESFPSGHALFFFALATVVYMYNKKIGTVLYVAGLLMVCGRVAAGLHYPSDVVVGALLGTLSAYVIVKVVQRYVPCF
jgi:undecaprenyl-diphosphatase